MPTPIRPCRNALDQGHYCEEDEIRSSYKIFEPLWVFENLTEKGVATKDLGRLSDTMSKFQRPLELFLNPTDLDVGPYLRWLVGLKVILRLRCPERTWSQVIDDHNVLRAGRHSTPAKNVLLHELGILGDSDTFDRLFHHTPGHAWKVIARYARGDLLNRIIDRLRTLWPDRADRLSVETFLSVHNGSEWEYPNDSPLYRFECWLLHGIHPPKRHSLGSLMCETYLRSPLRELQLSTTVDRLVGDSDRPILNIFARSTWSGLRAFATSVLAILSDRRARDKELIVGLVYIRLSRAGDETEADGTLVTATPPATLRGVIDQLRGVFSIPPTRASSISPLNLHEDLRELRRALTIYPTIIVFDGLDNGSGPIQVLFDAIRNTPYADLIRVLAQPDFDTLRQDSQSRFRSRFLVLSGDPLQNCAPWSISEQLCEAPPDAWQALYRPASLTTESVKQIAIKLRAKESKIGLAELYPIKDEQSLRLLAKACLPAPLPAETDLALASLLAHGTIKEVVNALAPNSHPSTITKGLFAAVFDQTAREHPLDLIALQFVALSIDGMRVDTLIRSMRAWCARMLDNLPPTSADDLVTKMSDAWSDSWSDRTIEALVTRYRPILVEGYDDALEGITTLQAEYELVMRPEAESRATPARPRVLDMRHHDIRHLMIRQMLTLERSNQDTGDANLWQRDAWELIQLIVADEALRQATTQMRNLPLSALANAHVLRRFIQAAFHGLLSFQEVASGAPVSPVQLRLSEDILPIEVKHKRRYLYLFVYKKLIENAPTWTLARAFGQLELRFALLALYCASPADLREFLNGMFTTEATATRTAQGIMERLSVTIIDRWQERSDRGAPISALSWDLLETFCRSAHDLGLSDAVKGLLLKLARCAAPKARQRTASEIGGLPFGLRKLLIDCHQVDFEQLGEAERLCRGELEALGVPPEQYCKLEKYYPSVGPASNPAALHGFHASLKRCADNVRTTSSEGAQTISDLLIRQAEIAATAADADPDWINKGGSFLAVYGTYYMADQLRARVGASGTEWGAVSARSMRYWIRVCYKLAKVWAQRDAVPNAEAIMFFEQGRRYTDLYGRHLFRLPRERLSMLLLLASATRIWAELPKEPTRDKVLGHLHASLDYLTKAEEQLLELGAPGPLCNRFFFERQKTLRRLEEHDKDESLKWKRLGDSDVLRLESLAHTSFWRDMVKRATRIKK